MSRKRRPDDLSLFEFQRLIPDEAAARRLVERLRWPDGPVCPRCRRVVEVCRPKNRPEVRVCLACKRHFSLRSGTPMHGSRVPLRSWLLAMYCIAGSSKGVSSLQLQKILGLGSYQTSWHMNHRIRAMMAAEDPLLTGVVEIDEVYAGAPPRAKNRAPDDGSDDGPSDGRSHPTGRGTKRPLVLTVVERDGALKMQRIESHSKAAIGAAVAGLVAPAAVTMTDALPAYRHLGVRQAAHHTVNHSAGVYTRHEDDLTVHVNTAEAVHSLLRRAVQGVFHWISSKHLDRYLTEIGFRWSRRAEGVLTRIAALLAAEVPPLTYRSLVRP